MGEVTVVDYKPDAFVPPPNNVDHMYVMQDMARPPNAHELHMLEMLLERNNKERVTVVVGAHLYGKSAFILRLCTHLAEAKSPKVACVFGSDEMFRVGWLLKTQEEWENIEVYSSAQSFIPDDHTILLLDDVQRLHDLVAPSRATRIIATCNPHDFARGAMTAISSLANLVVPDDTNDIPSIIHLTPPNPMGEATSEECWRRHIADKMAVPDIGQVVLDPYYMPRPNPDLPTLQIFATQRAADDAMQAILRQRTVDGEPIVRLAYRKNPTCKVARSAPLWEGMLVFVTEWHCLGQLVKLYTDEEPYFEVDVGQNRLYLTHAPCTLKGCHHLPIEPMVTTTVYALPWIGMPVNLKVMQPMTGHNLLRIVRAGAPLMETSRCNITQETVLQMAHNLPTPDGS